MKTLIIIPARFGATRFPGKPLALIAGKPMIEHVYKRAKESRLASKVIVATEDERVINAVKAFGGEAVMTPAECATGTDRIAYAARGIEADAVVNVQGDEPLINPELIDACIEALAHAPQADVTTPVSIITDASEITNPNIVKVALTPTMDALYFSRASIPFARDASDGESWFKHGIFYKHIGLYAYRRKTLERFTALPESPLERTERLEQLRLVEDGARFRCVLTTHSSIAVDVPEDVKKVEDAMKR